MTMWPNLATCTEVVMPKSSLIHVMGWNRTKAQLHVVFLRRDGKLPTADTDAVYVYDNVSEALWQWLSDITNKEGVGVRFQEIKKRPTDHPFTKHEPTKTAVATTDALIETLRASVNASTPPVAGTPLTDTLIETLRASVKAPEPRTTPPPPQPALAAKAPDPPPPKPQPTKRVRQARFSFHDNTKDPKDPKP